LAEQVWSRFVVRTKHQQWLWWWGKPSYKYYKQSPVTYTIIHNIYIYATYEPVLSGGLTLGFATFCFPFLTLELLLVDVKPWWLKKPWPIHVPRTAVRPSCNLVPGRRSHMIRLCEPTYCVRNVGSNLGYADPPAGSSMLQSCCFGSWGTPPMKKKNITWKACHHVPLLL
jgi:hypothetical protein